MAKRIVLSFDGTWNKTADTGGDAIGAPTNVARFHGAVLPTGPDGLTQIKRYIAGVGTAWYDRFTGGGLGLGVSNNMAEGYRWLAEAYEDGDAVFVVGFSRGAYTARALCGFIAKCGLLTAANVSDETIANAYAYYKDRALDASAFRAQYAREINIAFLGVWDTVGALGIPLRALDGLNDFLFAFHDRTLSTIVDRAYHALALDEHRADYEACLWDAKPRDAQVMEQRWFSGDHCDAGGGHTRAAALDPYLADLTLAWMMRKATDAGLGIDPVQVPGRLERCGEAECHDTYLTFLDGVYAQANPRYARPVGATRAGNEAVDDTVYARRAQDLTYRPTNPGLRPL